MDVEEGRIRRVRTTGGDIEAETVVIACGVWSPKLAKMAGASIPLTPAVHQMISVGPIPQLAERPGEISFPIVRDMDTFCYERQHGADMEVGSYAHRAILYDADEIPSIEQSKLSPTELPFTADDFDPQLEQAFELMPDALGADGAEIRYAINGLLSLTPDGGPLLGETPEVKGLWSAAAVWIKEGPGVGRAVAEWMTHGHSEIDVHHADIARFYPHQRTRAYVRSRTSEAFNKTYGIVHPGEQWAGERGKRLAPMHAAQRAAGAEFFETVGWERPFWYKSNEALLGEYGDRVLPREHEWDARWWSPIINAEHLAMRERRRHRGPVRVRRLRRRRARRAAQAVQGVVVAQTDVADGRVIYTPVLDAEGRLPLGPHRDAAGPRPLPRGHRRPARHGGPQVVRRPRCPPAPPVVDQTSAFTTIGLWGPRARDILGRLTDADISHAGFPFLTCRRIELGNVEVLASRISYVGELGWELYVPMEQGARLWDLLHEAGGPTGPSRSGSASTAPPGGWRRATGPTGSSSTASARSSRPGMARPKVKDADFVGREAYLAQREAAPQTVLCTLTVDDHTSAGGGKRYMLGGEPILTRDGGTLTDGHGRHPYVTSAGSAPSLGTHVLMAYLPPDQAVVGNALVRLLHGRAVPGDRAEQRRHAAVRPDQRADQGLSS